MKSSKKIVRNKAVFCAMSKFRNASNKNTLAHQCEKEPFELIIEHILSDIFEEQVSYQTLLYYYEDALLGNDNVFFSHAYFCDTVHAIRLDKERKILLYFYQDKIRMGKKPVLPWEYPHLITCIGTADDNMNIYSVLLDLKSISVLDFFLKYFIHSTKRELTINQIANGYLVNDSLKIIINDHITFQWIESPQIHQEMYIADSWGETKEEIMDNLTHMSFLKFGKEYLAFWGR